MDDRDYKRVFDQVKLLPEREEAMLESLLCEKERTRPVKKVVTVLVAAALLLLACAFTVAIELDQRILKYFGGTEENSHLLSEGVVAAEQSFYYENGWTIEIAQVLADRYSLAVLVEVTAPEGTVLDGENYYFELDMEMESPLQSRAGVEGWGYGPALLEDEDPEDNHLTFLCFNGPEHASEARAMMGQEVTLCPLWLQESGGRKLRVDFSEEEQSCTVKLPEEEQGKIWLLEAPIQVGDGEMKLGEVYLSPITLAFSLQGEENDLDMWNSTEMTHMEEEAVLHMADGEAVTIMRVTSQSYDSDTGEIHCVFQTDQVIEPENVVSVTILGQTFSLDHMISEAG